MTKDAPHVASNPFTPVEITASGADDVTVLTYLLRQTFATIDGMELPPHAHIDAPVIGFRAAASNNSRLLVEMVKAAAAESDLQNVRVLAIDIAGIMPVDEGIRCWGYLAVTDRATDRPAFTISGDPVFRRDGELIRGDLTLLMERVQ